MSPQIVLSLFIAFFMGIATSPVHSGDIISCDSFENCPDGSDVLTSSLLALEARMDALEAENAELKALLAGVSRITDPNTSQDTLRFTDMNVQIVNGGGERSGAPTGTGNLIIGYNESRGETECPNGFMCDRRGGSHMLVIGIQNNYSSSNGMVVGVSNETRSGFASVSGGTVNIASGYGASVSGGNYNTASGMISSVSGGLNNTASGRAASVSGGTEKTASTDNCTVGDDGVDC